MPKPDVIENAVKLIGEIVVVPGTSQLLDGNLKSGAVHAALGLAARAVFGLPGLLLIAADSFSQSVSDKSLYGHATDAYHDVFRSSESEGEDDGAAYQGSKE